MSERFGPLPEKMLQDLLPDFEEASEDMVLKRAVDEALLLEAYISHGNISEEEIEKRLYELNTTIYHVYAEAGVIKLLDTEYDTTAMEDDGIDGAAATFYGFKMVRVGEEEFAVRSAFGLTRDSEKGIYLQPEDVQQDNENESVAVVMLAPLDAIKFESTIVHPQRARAWLDLAAPELSRDLDDRLAAVSSDIQGLVNLSTLKIPAQKPGDGFYEKMRISATYEYANAMATVDTEEPYIITLKGQLWLPLSDGSCQLVEPDAEVYSQLFNANSLCLFQTIDDDAMLEFCLKGFLPDEDPTIPSTEVIIPLSSLSSVQSIRTLMQ